MGKFVTACCMPRVNHANQFHSKIVNAFAHTAITLAETFCVYLIVISPLIQLTLLTERCRDRVNKFEQCRQV